MKSATPTSQELDLALYGKSKGSKYKNEPCIVEGIWFQSKREGARYSQLLLLQRAGYIVGEIRRQVPYVLEVNGVKICSYFADFVYCSKDGKTVVEDSKGMRTREYILKAKLMLAVHGVRVVVV